MSTPPRRWKRLRAFVQWVIVLGTIALLVWGWRAWQHAAAWREYEAFLAECDRHHPGWRWQEWTPSVLRNGQPNGAIKFIEVGKKIDPSIMEVEEEKDDGFDYDLDYHELSKTWYTVVEYPKTIEAMRQRLARAEVVEKELHALAILQPGCPQFKRVRPTGMQAMIGKDLIEDERPFNLTYFWLSRYTHYHKDVGHGKEALLGWRAMLSHSQVYPPGMIFYVGTRYHFQLIRALQQILARTEPDEASLLATQAVIPIWRESLITKDDLHLDRALVMEALEEMHRREIEKPNRLASEYASAPDFLPREWRARLEEWGWNAPLPGTMYRNEVMTNFAVIELLEGNLQASRPMTHGLSKLIESDPRYRGKHYDTYYMPRWKKILADLNDMRLKLHCLEATLAAERYRIKNGNLPEQWSDLVPTYLAAMPTDQLQVFHLKRKPDGLAIYHRHNTQPDLGGEVLRAPDSIEWPKETGIMLFNPEYRRQQPPPPKKKERREE